MSDLDTLQLDEKLHLLEPMIQKIVQEEFRKLMRMSPVGLTAEIPTSDFWTALQQFRCNTDLSEFSEDTLANLRDNRLS
jgi:hypothetical protein